ncbi:MAG: hypothetical protein WAU78_18135 [Roseiarcus sp.]
MTKALTLLHHERRETIERPREPPVRHAARGHKDERRDRPDARW